MMRSYFGIYNLKYKGLLTISFNKANFLTIVIRVKTYLDKNINYILYYLNLNLI